MVRHPRDATTAQPPDAPAPLRADESLGPLRFRAIDSAALLGGARELCINHSGEIYRLRITRQNKLILTK
ncbi:MAG: hemin uptake protein HemP [Steroidobacteraceae bacterium]|jgi:hemin uptake protein HemP|nr:hemin uptake protein HemP [Steroidobacteraceae bacterium]